MSKLLIRLVINAIALAAAAFAVNHFVPEGIIYGDWVDLLAVAAVFGVINAVIKPILKLIACLPIVLTLGLFTLVINALMLLLTGEIADFLGLNFQVDGFWTAVLGAIIVSIVSIILSVFVKEDK